MKRHSTRPTPVAKEMTVLAMVVRGDKASDIAKEMEISVDTVDAIKKRNSETLEVMKARLADHRLSQATRILDKANKAIEHKLDQHNTSEDRLDQIRRRFELGEINIDEYQAQLAGIERATITELTAVSREMASQAKLEGVASSSNPADVKDRLIELVDAIKSGDEVALERIVFNPKAVEVVQ